MSAALEVEVIDRVPTRTYNRYSDTFKASALIALAANNGNLLRTCRELQIPIKTLQLWRDGKGVNPEVVEFYNESRVEVADRLDYCRDLIIESLPDKVGAAGLKDSSVALAVLIDKSQLLRGEPTEIIQESEHQMIIESLLASVAEKIEQRRLEALPKLDESS